MIRVRYGADASSGPCHQCASGPAEALQVNNPVKTGAKLASLKLQPRRFVKDQ